MKRVRTAVRVVELASDHSVHGEACLDEGGKSVTFYVLGGDLKTPKVVESFEFEVEVEEGDDEKELPATAKPLEGEEEGKCSCFVVDTSSLGELENLDHLHAHVHVTIDGTEYKGSVAGHAHDDHDAHAEGDHKEGEHDGDDHDEHGHTEKDGHDHDGEEHGDDHDKDKEHDHDGDDHDHKEGEHKK